MVTWLLIIIFTALVAWVILAATIRLGGFGEVTAPLPKTRDLISENEQHLENNAIAEVRFHIERRGYNQAEVDAAIEYLVHRLAKAEGREMPESAETEMPADFAAGAAAELAMDSTDGTDTGVPSATDNEVARVRSGDTLD